MTDIASKKKKKLPTNVRERNGKYYYRYSIKNPVTGKRKQKETEGFATPQEAKREGARIQAELLKGTYLEKSDLTLSDWSKDWLKWYSATGRVKEITVAQRTALVGLLNAQIGGLDLDEITEDVYQEALYILSEHHSFNTLSSLHGCSKMIFARAVQKGKLKSNPTEHALVPKKVLSFEEQESAKRLPHYLEKDELKRFFAAEGNPQIRRVFELLAYTGLRIGELSALFVEDFDGESELKIYKTRYVPKSITQYKLTSPKNKSSDRTIQLSKKAVSIIKEQLAWRKEFAFSKGSQLYRKKDFLFICEKSRAGYPLHYTTISKHMKAALIKAGLPSGLTPHSLRHTYTSLMAEAGADLDTIQAQLGHKKGSDVTRSVYLHVTKAREKRDVDRLDALLEATD